MWDGWIVGGGHPQPDRHRTIAVTASHGLAMDMYAIGQALGLRPAIELLRRGKPGSAAASRRESWRITVSAGDLSNRSRQDASHVWRKVVGLEHEDWAGFVYNIEVEGDHSYVAEGVGVHNCVGFGVSRLATHLNRRPTTALALPRGAEDRLVAGRELRGHDRARRPGHPAQARPSGRGPTAAARPDRSPRASTPTAGRSNVDDVLSVLGYTASTTSTSSTRGGDGYPHLMRMPATVLDRLRREEGEIGLVTDR